MPLPDTARDALAAMTRDGRPAIGVDCARRSAARGAQRRDRIRARSTSALLPAHLRLRVAVVDADGRVLGASRELAVLQRELGAGPGTAAVEAAPARWQRTGLTRWDFGDLPPTVVVAQRPRALTLYPALVDVDGRVDLGLEPPGAAAVALHRGGVRRLLLKALPQQAALIRDRTLADRALVLAYHGVGDGEALVDDLLLRRGDAGVRARSARAHGRGIRGAPRRAAAAQLVAEADALRELLSEILPLQRALRRELETAAKSDAHANVRTELTAQLAGLVGPRMLTEHAARVAAAPAALSARGRATLAEARAAQRAGARGRGAHGRRAARPLAGIAAARHAVACRQSSSTAGSSRSFVCRCSRSSSAPRAPCPRSGSSKRGARRSRVVERYGAAALTTAPSCRRIE